jgi:hypothetical protein
MSMAGSRSTDPSDPMNLANMRENGVPSLAMGHDRRPWIRFCGSEFWPRLLAVFHAPLWEQREVAGDWVYWRDGSRRSPQIAGLLRWPQPYAFPGLGSQSFRMFLMNVDHLPGVLTVPSPRMVSTKCGIETPHSSEHS